MKMNYEVLNYMKRHFLITDVKEDVKTQSIYIDGKSRFLYSNKKRMKNKIFEVIESKFPFFVDTQEKKGEVMKTIKIYIDQIRRM